MRAQAHFVVGKRLNAGAKSPIGEDLRPMDWSRRLPTRNESEPARKGSGAFGDKICDDRALLEDDSHECFGASRAPVL